MPIGLSFHGGVEGVTGSCYLLRAGGLQVLVDCGLFQGDPRREEMNFGDFGFDPSSVDYLLLTHGHLDHCGRIPVLVKKGFRGKVLSTAATLDIAKIVLMDTAGINEEDYLQWKKILERRGQTLREPLYTTIDALDAVGFFAPGVSYGRPFRLNDSVRVTFKDAGHILGAAFIEVEVREEARILFSGDLGNTDKPIIRDPEFPGDSDVAVVESTYAERNHRSFEESVRELQGVVNETFRRGGNVLIPAFAIERAQDLLFVLRESREKGILPYCSVFLDSPMAIDVTDVMRRHPECFDEETRGLFREGRNPFGFEGLQFTRTPEESRKINGIKRDAIIIAGSGMITGGRIKHHLKHNIWRRESSLVFVGYQAEGTPGREIVDGAKEIRIFDEPYMVNASVHTIGGFSSHAGRDGLINWIKGSGKPSHVFLVHGEGGGVRSLKAFLEENGLAREVHVPSMNEKFTL
jgi:metallo-beta-lactamase family protein